ncbi:MAG: Hsp20/alpha crystallin family protein [Saprospiraceae bacterium]|nr:Hsp20/alpha crystallin family protein [Saprospiraceae bacterium]
MKPNILNMMYTNYYSAIPKVFSGKAPCANDTLCKTDLKSTFQKTVIPKMNVEQHEQEIRLEFSLPGVLKDQLNLQFKDQLLTLQAQRILEDTPQVQFKHREFGNVKYERILQLPEDIISDSIEAKLVNGILKVTLKRAPKRTKTIEVK